MSSVNLLDSVSMNHAAGLLRDSMNDRRFSKYQKSLDKKGKVHYRARSRGYNYVTFKDG